MAERRYDEGALRRTAEAARGRLLVARGKGPGWRGRLASSALATATAAFALEAAGGEQHGELVRRGRRWLAANQNADGGWGDTVLSRSNVSTTALGWAALAGSGEAGGAEAAREAEQWLGKYAGGRQVGRLAEAIAQRYGPDRTFSAPILSMLALAGRLGREEEAWGQIPALPFEWSALPAGWWRRLGLPVVSYALPALIALGQLHYARRRVANPLVRAVRGACRARTLAILESMQPESGGFLEAAPLTSFVVMSLAGAGAGGCGAARRGVEFLARTARADGSWAIDTDLATWLTTLAVRALGADGRLEERLSATERAELAEWLLEQQHGREHPYTHAAAGGWGWTDLPGGVPDADDTAGALLALRKLGASGPRVQEAAARGVRWLLDLQNGDGGMPTFCRGWGRLEFDRSAPDLTAHALAAWAGWRDKLSGRLQARVGRAARRALRFLRRAQRAEGSWAPLWFGNESGGGGTGEENGVYGTARVAAVLLETAGERSGDAAVREAAERGMQWLLGVQHTDGGWGGGSGSPSSIEETALAVEAIGRQLRGAKDAAGGPSSEAGRRAAARDGGVAWLIERTEEGTVFPAAPIGLYFAKLWYYEELYPVIFTVGALGQVVGER